MNYVKGTWNILIINVNLNTVSIIFYRIFYYLKILRLRMNKLILFQWGIWEAGPPDGSGIVKL